MWVATTKTSPWTTVNKRKDKAKSRTGSIDHQGKCPNDSKNKTRDASVFRFVTA